MPKIRWTHNEKTVKHTKRVYTERTESRTTLVINDTEVEDQGQYNVSVENSAGTDERYVTLAVIGKHLKN